MSANWLGTSDNFSELNIWGKMQGKHTARRAKSCKEFSSQARSQVSMKLITVTLVLLALAATVTSTNPCGPFPAEKGGKIMKFYIWDVSEPYQDQVVTVKRFPGQPTKRVAGSGGSIYTKLTALPVYNSTECGRNEGFFVTTSLDLTTNNLQLSHKFHGLGYLSSAGLYNGTAGRNELPVYGGVGVFKGAEGSYKAQVVKRYGTNKLIRAEIYYTTSSGSLPKGGYIKYP